MSITPFSFVVCAGTSIQLDPRNCRSEVNCNSMMLLMFSENESVAISAERCSLFSERSSYMASIDLLSNLEDSNLL